MKEEDEKPTAELKEPSAELVRVALDQDGHTVTQHCRVSGFSMQDTIPTSPPLWTTGPSVDPKSGAIWVMTADWKGGWHPNPTRQLVVPLSGKWWVETQDGVRTVMGPGDLYLGDDVGALPDEQGRKGHDSGTEGEDPVVLLMIPVGERMFEIDCS